MSETTSEFVVGFMFSEDRQRLVLMKKNRPAHMAGKLNGPGGKIQAGKEMAVQAMCRAFREETGVETTPSNWNHFCTLKYKTTLIFFYSAFMDVEPKTTTDEPVRWYDLNTEADEIFDGCLDNMHWMLPLALSTANEFVVAQEP